MVLLVSSMVYAAKAGVVQKIARHLGNDRKENISETGWRRVCELEKTQKRFGALRWRLLSLLGGKYYTIRDFR